jgi:hypothetical protein
VAIDTQTPSSRRSLLAASVGALAALAAGAVARPLSTRAANGDALTVGGKYNATGTTRIIDSSTSADVFRGVSTSGTGVHGLSTSGTGVRGEAPQGTGLFGKSTDSYGVVGESTSGIGVFGGSSSSTGVHGSSDTGVGVVAISVQDIALHATSPFGYAVEAIGRIRLSTSGVGIVPAGATSRVVNPGVDVTASSYVLLTPAADIGPRRLWYTLNSTADTITIHLSSPRAKATKVTWLLLG